MVSGESNCQSNVMVMFCIHFDGVETHAFESKKNPKHSHAVE